jgi:LCP family protein required for cell wall assembly
VWVHTYLVALIAAVAVLFATIVGVNRAYDEKIDDIPTIDVDVAEITDPGEPANFLVIGSDTRAFVETDDQEEAFGDPAEQAGQRSDTIMVVHVDPRKETGLVVSFPRDLLVVYPDGRTDRINAAYNSEDGPNELVTVFDQNFGIPIHHYLEIDFSSFREIVNAVGGVPVEFEWPVIDPCTGLDVVPFGVAFPATFVLDGDDALAYVRSRNYIELQNGEWVPEETYDLGRVERQQDFLRRLAGKAVSVALSNPVRGNRIANETLTSITVDEALDRDDIDRLIRAFRDIDPNRPETLQTETFPWEPTGDNATLRPDRPAAEPLLARLRGDPVPAARVPMATISFTAPVAASTPGSPSVPAGDAGSGRPTCDE